MAKIDVQGKEITIITRADDDYISLTDIAKYKNNDAPADIVKNWMRNRSTVEFLGLWEKLNNPNFKLVEFDQFKKPVRRFLKPAAPPGSRPPVNCYN